MSQTSCSALFRATYSVIPQPSTAISAHWQSTSARKRCRSNSSNLRNTDLTDDRFLFLLVCFRPVFRGDERLAVVDQHDHSDRQAFAYLFRRGHRNSNAAATLRRRRHGRMVVCRKSIAEVVGIVMQTEW